MLIKKTRFVLLVLCFCLSFGSFVYANDLSLQGELSQGGLIVGKVSPGELVFFNGQPLKVTPQGDFVFGLGRDAEATQVLAWGSDKNSLKQQDLDIKQREYKTQYIEGVPQKTVTPPAETLDRIRAETALVKRARKTESTLEHFSQPFIVPIDAPVTGVYGSQRVYNGTPKRPHYGIDYAGPHGAPVAAPANGVVTLVHDDMYYSGGTLIVDHGYGVSSTFIHLSEVLVKEGDEIKQGDVIAKVGSGGRSTGPHLDWRVNWFDVRVDPQLVLKVYSE